MCEEEERGREHYIYIGICLSFTYDAYTDEKNIISERRSTVTHPGEILLSKKEYLNGIQNTV